jgi:hypothetical protein
MEFMLLCRQVRRSLKWMISLLFRHISSGMARCNRFMVVSIPTAAKTCRYSCDPQKQHWLSACKSTMTAAMLGHVPYERDPALRAEAAGMGKAPGGGNRRKPVAAAKADAKVGFAISTPIEILLEVLRSATFPPGRKQGRQMSETNPI